MRRLVLFLGLTLVAGSAGGCDGGTTASDADSSTRDTTAMDTTDTRDSVDGSEPGDTGSDTADGDVGPAVFRADQAGLRVDDQVVPRGGRLGAGRYRTITVASVEAPRDGWVVVRATSQSGSGPGRIVGTKAVTEGTSQGINVQLSSAAQHGTHYAALHVDRGERGSFDYGPENKVDVPVVSDGSRVRETFQVKLGPHVKIDDQAPTKMDFGIRRLAADQVVAPEDAWAVLYKAGAVKESNIVKMDSNSYAKTSVGPGRHRGVNITYSKGNAGGSGTTLQVVLHRDTGQKGTFEFGGGSGVDQPLKTEEGKIAKDTFELQ